MTVPVATRSSTWAYFEISILSLSDDVTTVVVKILCSNIEWNVDTNPYKENLALPCAVQHKVTSSATYFLSVSRFYTRTHTHMQTHASTHSSFSLHLGLQSHQHLQSVGLFKRNKADIYCGLSLSVKAQICGAHKPHLSFLPVKI